MANIIYGYNGPGTIRISTLNASCVHPDSDGDVIIAKIQFLSEGSGDTAINIFATEAFEPSFWGCDSSISQYRGNYHTFTIHQTIIDSDDDGTPDHEDNCPETENPNQTNLDNDSHGDVCDNCPYTDNEDQFDADDDGIGDACDTDGEAIPTLSEWGMIIFMTFILGISVAMLLRRRSV